MKTMLPRSDVISRNDSRHPAQGLAVAAVLVATLLAGCSTISDVMQGEKVDYKTAGGTKAPSLDVPPDLSQLSRDTRYVVPGTAVSANISHAVRPGTL